MVAQAIPPRSVGKRRADCVAPDCSAESAAEKLVKFACCLIIFAERKKTEMRRFNYSNSRECSLSIREQFYKTRIIVKINRLKNEKYYWVICTFVSSLVKASFR